MRYTLGTGVTVALHLWEMNEMGNERKSILLMVWDTLHSGDLCRRRSKVMKEKNDACLNLYPRCSW